jgi:hypothetical protein
MTVLHLQKPTDYHCPPWCESPDHSPGELAANDGRAMHFGPEFGSVSVQQQTGEQFGVMLAYGDDSIILTPEELGSLLGYGASAQKWLEARR